MGASASRGRDNESLMDKLVESGYTLPPEVERAMRLVDRGSYFEEKSDRAYMDLAWRSGSLHLSAPSIYMTALNNLDLEPGLHFLNVGSGSGYLSTIVGLVLGYHGVNHGIELNSSNVEFAKTRLAQFLNESDAIFECDFCIPQFVQGNIFDLVVPSGNGRTFASLRNPQAQANEDSNSVSQRVIEIRNHQRDQNLEMVVGVEEVEEEDAHDANPANGLQDANEENSDSSEDEDIETSIGSFGPNSEPWKLTIEPPPVVTTQSIGISGDDPQLVQWPVYDRIYVGAAIDSADQFLAVLRLLKIGGVMIAPVRDKFVKLIRRSENVFDWTNLLSVSFASLVVPQPDTRTSFDPPPPIQLPTLERLTTRVIRSVLRQVVLHRQNGKLPTIGKLKEVDSAGQPRKRRNCAHRDTSTNSSTTSYPDNSAEPFVSGTVGDKPSNSLGEPDDGVHEAGSEDSNSNPPGDDESEVDDEENEEDVDESDSHSPTYTVIGARPRSPSDTDSNSSLSSQLIARRLIHSECLRSCTAPSLRSSLIQLANGNDRSNPTDANRPDNPSDPTDSNRNPTNPSFRSFLEWLMTGGTVPDQTEGPRDTQSTSSTLEASTPTPMEQETTAPEHSVRPPAECTSSSSYNATTDADRVRKIMHRRRSRRKRKTELRYIPPSYVFKDEMRKILCDEIGLPDHYIRRILTL